MLMRLDLALITEAAGRMVTGEAAVLAGEDKEEAKPLVIIYMPKMYNNQPNRSVIVNTCYKTFTPKCKLTFWLIELPSVKTGS